MKKTILILLAVAVTILSFCQPLTAIPAFARKHGFNCNMCHVAYPKLNDFGQRFRDNGYQIPGQSGMEKTVFETSIPLALRTTAGHSLYKNKQGTTAGFGIYGLDLLAAGVLHKNISFLFVYTPRIDDPAADFRGAGNGSNPAQIAAIESASVVFSNLAGEKLNLRVGRFEPAYHLLSSKRSYFVRQPYEIFNFQAGSNPYEFAVNQVGIEASGRFQPGLKYSLGIINGSGGAPDNNTGKDVYVTLQKTFGKGEGQSAGQRLGVFGYFGRQPSDFIRGTVVAPTGENNGRENRSFFRLGGSLSLNWKTVNFQALVMKGGDNKAFNHFAPTRDYSFWGGVAQLDVAALANNRLVASLLYNWVQPSNNDRPNRVAACSALLRYYLGSWSAVNIALHAEYTHRSLWENPSFKDDVFTLLLDFDF
ncbi:MAG TPA: hypothetical protein VF451_03350 [Acidobacteriota bacterium]